MILLIKTLKISAVECFSYFSCQIVIEIEIVNDRKSHSERFLGFNKVSYIGTAVISAGGTIAGH